MPLLVLRACLVRLQMLWGSVNVVPVQPGLSQTRRQFIRAVLPARSVSLARRKVLHRVKRVLLVVTLTTTVLLVVLLVQLVRSLLAEDQRLIASACLVDPEPLLTVLVKALALNA
jgi:hypothetical protein